MLLQVDVLTSNPFLRSEGEEEVRREGSTVGAGASGAAAMARGREDDEVSCQRDFTKDMCLCTWLREEGVINIGQINFILMAYIKEKLNRCFAFCIEQQIIIVAFRNELFYLLLN
jgi:hypothetical protein